MLALNARLSLDEEQNLVLHSDDPQLHRLTLEGQWSLDADHQLSFRLQEEVPQMNQRKLVFQTQILSAQKNSLDVALTYRFGQGVERTELLKFKGVWQMSRYNRLQFELTGKNAAKDQLVFQGTWDLDQDHQIRYRLTQKEAGLKEHLLLLRGQWRLWNDKYLAYWLEGDSRHRLQVRAFWQTKTIRPAQSSLRFRVGIGFRKTVRIHRQVEVLGQWRFGKKTRLDFEYTLPPQDKVAFQLSWLQSSGLRWSLGLEQERAQKQWRVQLELELTKDDLSWVVAWASQSADARVDVGFRYRF